MEILEQMVYLCYNLIVKKESLTYNIIESGTLKYGGDSYILSSQH